MDASAQRTPPALRAHERRWPGRAVRDVIVQDRADWSDEALADDFGVSLSTIQRWLRVLGIERRTRLVLRDDHDADATADAPPGGVQAVHTAGSRS